MQVALGGGVVLNSGSKLKRSSAWVVDPLSPLRLTKAEMNVGYISGRVSGDYQYRVSFMGKTTAQVVAMEIRTIVHDVFGRYLTTLQATEVGHFQPEIFYEPTWRIGRETEAKTAFTSISYVARARTEDGKVYAPNQQALLAAIRAAVPGEVLETQLEVK